MQLISAYVVVACFFALTNICSPLQEDVQEDWGWKLVHGEVFRPPTNVLPLSVLVGNGTQLAAMAAVTLGSLVRIFREQKVYLIHQSSPCWVSSLRLIVVRLQLS